MPFLSREPEFLDPLVPICLRSVHPQDPAKRGGFQPQNVVLYSDGQIGIVLVEQDISRALAVADRFYCLLEGPDEESIRKHHEALHVSCGEVHQVDSLL